MQAMRAIVLCAILWVAGAAQTRAADSTPKVAPKIGPSPSLVWLAKPTPQQLMQAYPERAKRLGLSGQALIRCTIEAAGTLTACSVQEEAPENNGFGGAAISLSKFLIAYPKSFRDNQVVAIPMKFKLPNVPDTEAEDTALCGRVSDREAQIKGCTALIQTGEVLPHVKAWAYAMRGAAYESARLYPQAIDDYNQIAVVAPRNADGLARIARIHSVMGKYDLAKSEYVTAIRLNPSKPTYYLYRATMYSKENDADRAIRDYTVFIKMSAISTDSQLGSKETIAAAYDGRARSYHAKGEDAVALADAEKAVSMARRNAEAIETRAEIYEKLGRRDEAITDYRAALQYQSHMKEAQDGLRRLGAVP